MKRRNLETKVKEGLSFYFNNKLFLPLTLIGALLMIIIVKEVSPAIKENYSIGLDLQEHSCLPFIAYGLSRGSVDSSMPYSKKIELRKGMFVSFIPSNNMMGMEYFDGKRIIKKVAGLPGDVLKVENDKAYINGEYWGDLSLLGTLQKEAGYFDREVVIPEGDVLLLGTLPTSYDGRYYGFINQSVISASALPLL